MKQITVAVCLALMPLAADAAGLGKLTVISGLGQPLVAEIELLSATKDELTSMSARIAPSSAYAEQGIERASILSAVRVELSKLADGVPILKITTPQSVNDPFLDMLIEVDWSSGRLLREYTALLDPPGFGDQPAAASVAAPIAQDQSIVAAEKPISKPMSGARMSAEKKGKLHKGAAAQKAASDVDQAQTVPAGEDHVTKRGDTLHSIASQMPKVEGVSLEQMLVGVYRANPEAFDGSNMNRLKVGQIVRQPSAEELQAVSPQEAAKEIRVQTADWNTYRNKLASAVAESVPAKEESPRQAASGKISAAAEDKGAVQSAGPHDVVKLSKGDVAPGKIGAAAEAKGTAVAKDAKPDAHDKVSALQEEVTAREKSIKEANDRVALLEKQVQELKQLLEMKSQAMADLQKSAVAQKAEPAKPETPAPAKAEPAAPTAPAAKPEAAKPETADAAKPKHKPKKIVPPPVAEPGLMDTLLDDLMGNLPLLGGLLAALGGVGWLAARRKSKKETEAAEQVMPATSSAATAGIATGAGDTSFLTDFSQPAGGGMIDTSEVDPISEAEVYMAYGRDAQAEEILKDAIKKTPKRYELHVKLLEIYANRNDNAAFEPVANELYTAPGPTDPVWAKVAELGRRVDPNNPRYAVQPAESAAVESPGMAATQIFEVTEPAPAEAGTDTVPAPDLTLDFSLDAGTEAAEAGAPVAEVPDGNSLDFDMGALGGTDEVALAIPVAEDEAQAVADLNAFDSAVAIETPGDTEQLPALESEPEAETAGFDFSLELPEPAAEENVQLDETDLGIDVLPEITFPETEQPLEAPAEEPAAEAEPMRHDEAAMGIEALPELEEPSMSNATDDMALALPEMASDEAPEDIDLEELNTEPGELPSGFDLVLPEFEAPVAEESAEEVKPVAEEMSFELPNAEEFTAEEAPEATAPAESAPEGIAEEISLEAPVELPEAEEPAVDFDQAMILQASSAEEVPAVEPAGADETMQPETGAPEAGGFDLDLEAGQGGTKPAPEVDLSGIDLDLGDSGKAAVESGLEPIADDEITLSAGPESADVDTKLDLVTAYLDMGDKEGARELLQEVLDEGSAQQRERAQKMMDALD